MIAFSSRKTNLNVRSSLEQIRKDPDPVSALIDLGVLEAGILDHFGSGVVDEGYQAIWERATASAAERALGGDVGLDLGQLDLLKLPVSVPVSTPEGFAWYALNPLAYAESANLFFYEHRPPSVTVIGIRSIGTTLSSLVTTCLRWNGVSTRRTTVRPEGPPFRRTTRLSPSITPDGSEWFVVVDEGPGISGSSFSSVITALRERHVSLEKIVVFPSWDAPADALRCDEARVVWNQVQKYPAQVDLGPDLPDSARAVNPMSWRNRLASSSLWPPVHPNHSRLKYEFGESDRQIQARFAGFGRFGRSTAALAERVSESGYSGEVGSIKDGFLRVPLLEGNFLDSTRSREFIDVGASYLSFRSKLEASDEAGCSFDEVGNMVEVNCQEAGFASPNLSRFRAMVESQPQVMVDGRLMWWEWLSNGDGIFKLDSFDHCRDHFFPGMQDICWDVAGFCIEHQLQDSERQYFIAQLRRQGLAGDLEQRMSFYAVAYSAFRLGYCCLGAETLIESYPEESNRFKREAKRYRSMLQSGLEELCHG